MECKVLFSKLPWKFSRRFNRDIVECKGIQLVVFALQDPDLIETLWNVKLFNGFTYTKQAAI